MKITLQQMRDDIIKNYKYGFANAKSGTLCKKDLNLLEKWKFDAGLTKNNSNLLTETVN